MAWASGGDRGDAMGQRGVCDRCGGVGEGADATAIGARARLAPCSGGGVPIKEYGRGLSAGIAEYGHGLSAGITEYGRGCS